MKEERQKIRFLLSGCWKILDGNIWERVTEKEYAVNEGKVTKTKTKTKTKTNTNTNTNTKTKSYYNIGKTLKHQTRATNTRL